MPSVLLVGTPNSGKTALFNRLTGLNQRVANYPGITVDLSIGRLAKLPEVDLVDFPGTYSLRPISEEERVAVGHFDTSLADPTCSMCSVSSMPRDWRKASFSACRWSMPASVKGGRSRSSPTWAIF